jgi:hypothetical protein
MSAPKTEAPTVGAVQGFGEQGSVDSADSASLSNERKGFASLQAQFSLKGYALHRMADGSLLIERWGYSRTVENIHRAAQFLAQIGGT